MANKKLSITELRIERQSWASVLEDALSPKDREIFVKRKTAVDMYIDGINISKIEETTNVVRTSIAKFVAKCCNIDPNTNKPYGYSALIRYRHTEKHARNISDIYSNSTRGLFELFLSKNPSLVSFISDNYFGNKDRTLEKNMNITILHKKLLVECRKLGIQDYEYPFNTDSKGLRSLRRYVEKLSKQNEQKTIKRECKDARQRFNSTGVGHRYSKMFLSPYSVVQLDGHKIDMLYTVPVIHSDGSVSNLPATRVWLIAVIDVATRAILGYSLSSERNYNQTDVLAAIKDSIMPREKINFAIPGFNYPENGGFPCFAIEETNWAIFDSIMLDNAKAHLAYDVVNKLTKKLFCSVNFGPVASPEVRGIVERFFKTLEENGYHRTPSTTGSNAMDNRRENAEKDAIKYNITYNDIVELTEYLIAIYNNSPHSALGGRTPLEVMESRIKKAGMFPCIVNNKNRAVVNGLTNIIIERTVRGSYKSGKRPYVSYEGVEYKNEAVSISMSLVGTKLFLEVNPDDISSVLAYTEDGIELGYLRAAGVWGLRSHSLKTRKEALKFASKNKSNKNQFIAILDGYENMLRERAAKSRNARTKSERLRHEQESSNNILCDEIKNNPTNPNDQSIDIANDTSTISKKTNNERKTLNKNKIDSTSDEFLSSLEGMSFEEAYKKGLFK